MKKEKRTETKVIFRKYTSGIGKQHVGKGLVIALLPDMPCRVANYVMSYMHIGQHSDAEYNYVMRHTKPATQEEYASLYNELKEIGYENLRVMKRR